MLIYSQGEIFKMTISREVMIEVGAESVINARDFCVSKKREIEIAKEECLEQGFDPDAEIIQDIMQEADSIWNQNRYQAMAKS